MKEQTHTRRAFIWLLIPILMVAVTILVWLLAFTMEEVPAVIALVIGLLMFSFPVVQLGCSIASIGYQVKALRNHESQAKNFVMLAVSALYIVAAALYAYQFWIGIMSV